MPSSAASGRVASGNISRHRSGMTGLESELREGEVAVALLQHSDAGVYFIGTIHTRGEPPAIVNRPAL